jgi:hypothetical protein
MPCLPQHEPDYQYEVAMFHNLKAAKAKTEGRDLFVFRKADILFKVEVVGGTAETRQKLIASTAEVIRVFRYSGSERKPCQPFSRRINLNAPTQPPEPTDHPRWTLPWGQPLNIKYYRCRG